MLDLSRAQVVSLGPAQQLGRGARSSMLPSPRCAEPASVWHHSSGGGGWHPALPDSPASHTALQLPARLLLRAMGWAGEESPPPGWRPAPGRQLRHHTVTTRSHAAVIGETEGVPAAVTCLWKTELRAQAVSAFRVSTQGLKGPAQSLLCQGHSSGLMPTLRDHPSSPLTS